MVTGTVKLTPGIFKAYDIRGVLGATLDKDIAYQIGQAFGSAAIDCGEYTVVIGRDGRLSGPELSSALAASRARDVHAARAARGLRHVPRRRYVCTVHRAC